MWMTKRSIVDLETLAFSPEKAARILPHGIGQIARPSDCALGIERAQARLLQRVTCN
jgi:hypothetical protein